MVSIIPAPWSKYSDRLLEVRTAVFVEEQGVPSELEQDDMDALSFHVLLTMNHKNVATGRLLPDGHIGRVCVLNEFRGKGFGIKVMEALIQEASKRGLKEVLLSSQLHALGFYEKLGFEVVSEGYMEAGIPHKDMKFEID